MVGYFPRLVGQLPDLVGHFNRFVGHHHVCWTLSKIGWKLPIVNGTCTRLNYDNSTVFRIQLHKIDTNPHLKLINLTFHHLKLTIKKGVVL
ncbi:hypothetical protein HDC33_000487 [Sporosarcina sp. JAI121]|nr:hypothetical protein [Sporosarcina sp. JAI121]